MTNRLTLDDIADLRAYERERDEFRNRVIALKRKRRVSVGPHITFVFENADTIRFQIQEMARAERMLSDEAIQDELDTYNELIPGPGELSATMFLELTNKQELEEWLPKLVGIETAVQLHLGADPAAGGKDSAAAGKDSGAQVVRCEVDPAHAAALTREETTASVHYVRFKLTAAEIERFAKGPVALVIDHRHYKERHELSDATKESLLQDLRPSTR